MTSLTFHDGREPSQLFQQRRCAALCPVTISVHRQGVQHVDSLPAVVNDLTLICARGDAPRASASGRIGLFDSAAPSSGVAANLLSRAGLRDGVGLRWKASRGVPDAVLQ